MHVIRPVEALVALLAQSFLLFFILCENQIASAEFRYQGAVTDICLDKPSPNSEKPKTLHFELSSFERHPKYTLQEWKHDFPAGVFRRVLLGDFDCDGRADILAFEPGENQLLLGVSDGRGAFSIREVGALEQPEHWTSATVARMRQSACAQVVIADPEVAGARVSQLCGDYRFHWQSVRAFSHKFPIRSFHLRQERSGEDEAFYLETGIQESFVYGWYSAKKGFRTDIAPMSMPDAPRFLKTLKIDNDLPAYFAGEFGNSRLIYLNIERPLGMAVDFPSRPEPGQLAAGDLNGDGTDDVLVPSESARGSWIAFSYAGELVNFPNASLSTALRKKRVLGVADFDGDGRDEILLLNGGKLFVASANRGVSQKNKAVRLNGRTFYSDESGRIEFPVDNLSKVSVSADDSEDVVLNPRFLLDLSLQSRTKVHLLYDIAVRGEVGALLSPKQDAKNQGPYVCTSFTFGYTFQRAGRRADCPPDFVFVEMDDAGPLTLGSCCKLPRNDILTKSFSWNKASCPGDSIVTAVSLDPSRRGDFVPGSEPYVRCSEINTSKYVLGPPLPGILYGEGGSLSFASEDLDRSRIPLAARKGVGYLDTGGWDPDGCVGKPWGAILTGINGRECHMQTFRVLMERSEDSESKSLSMFPNCASMPDIYDPTRGCLPAKE